MDGGLRCQEGGLGGGRKGGWREGWKEGVVSQVRLGEAGWNGWWD